MRAVAAGLRNLFEWQAKLTVVFAPNSLSRTG